MCVVACYSPFKLRHYGLYLHVETYSELLPPFSPSPRKEMSIESQYNTVIRGVGIMHFCGPNIYFIVLCNQIGPYMAARTIRDLHP